MPVNDIYQDQICLNHASRGWSSRFFIQITKDLSELSWQVKSIDSVTLILQHQNSNRLLLGHVMSPWDMTYNMGLDSGTIIITDVVVKNSENKILKLYPEVFGEFHHEFSYTNHMPKAKFNCFINRGCPIRQSWMYQFQRRGLLDQGYVSYWCEDRFNNTNAEEFFETLYNKNNQIFEKEHVELRSRIPFKNFDLPLEHAILDSKCSVVIETYPSDNNFVCYSEKIWRSLQLPRPWMMFNVAYSVDQLRQWGFDVLDDYVDHSYDTKSNIIERQIAILDQLENEIALTPLDLEILEQKARHNRMLLLDFKQRWPTKYKSITEYIENISNNESLTLRA